MKKPWFIRRLICLLRGHDSGNVVIHNGHGRWFDLIECRRCDKRHWEELP